MKPDEKKKHDAPKKRTSPVLLIAYLSYALEDIQSLSPRSKALLASAITALAEDAHVTEDSKRQGQEQLVH
jgi:hypothetical protein